MALARLDEVGTDEGSHGHGVVDRRAAVLVGRAVETDVEVEHRRGRDSHAPVRAQALGVLLPEHRPVRDVEPDHRHVQPALEHARGRLGIGPDVELGRRGHVALRDGASHEHDAVDPRGRVGVPRQQERDVRERPEGDERQRQIRSTGLLGEEVHGVLVDRPGRGRREVRRTDAAVAVGILRGDEALHQRPVGAGRDRHVGPAGELEHAQGILCRPLERLVAGDRRDAAEVELGARDRQQERERVVDTRVAVDHDGRGHAGIIAWRDRGA